MGNIMNALKFAFERHAGQHRKVGGAPYIVHILDVARRLLCEADVQEEVIVAGILHDVLEDTDATPEELEREFGTVVCKLVQFVTEPAHDVGMMREQKVCTWKSRKLHTISSCRKASKEELLILLADKLSNLQSIREAHIFEGEAVWRHFNAPKDDILWYYCSLRQEFRAKLRGTCMFEIFDRLVDELSPN